MELTNLEKQSVFERIEPLVNSDMITYEKVKNNPILGPLAQKNNSYLINEKNINRALRELEQTQNDIKNIISTNPEIYESTAILAKVERYKLFSSQVIHSLLLQKDELRSAIMEMIKINEIEYGLKTREEEVNFRPTIEEPIKENKIAKVEMPEAIYFDENGLVKEEIKEEKPNLNN
jgi:hypothetical protein